jgi:hypothetical protein
MSKLLATSIVFLELPTPCSGIPELLATSIGFLELPTPCGGIPELLAISIGFLELQASAVVFQNCWLPP